AESQLSAAIRDLRNARHNAGMSQADVARAIGVCRALVSAWESRRYTPNPIQLAAWGAVVGLDLPIRTFAGGSPLNDAAQVRILERFHRAVGDRWTWRTEVPVVSDPRDRRAFDAVLTRGDRRVAAEVIARFGDSQGQVRPIMLKLSASECERVVLVVADTRHNRATIAAAAPTLDPDFGCPARVAMGALRAGEVPAGNAVVLI
ncbi:MAG TPA: helix-turn-helix transcriptional regulator, partial [Candidatus Limnocylindria bacterium]|nr:helix-turn-helix transcriptional regulator [Candidatus Limnocylindria bacterium]